MAALVVVFPGVGLSTAEVYGKFDASLTMEDGVSMFRSLSAGDGSLRVELRNDLEPAATHLRPELKEFKRELRALGARDAVMTGSGSGMFGIWNRGDDARAAAAWFRARGVWALATGIMEQLPAIEMDDAE
jgi:4-diphosphocytidyl-2-C-methyl-D-erythritol kinase